MDAVALEVRSRCRGCGASVPLDACVARVACAACQRPLEVGADVWKAVLAAPFAAPLTTDSALVDVAGVSVAIAYMPATASCATCKTPLPEEVRQFAARGWTMCPGCGHKLSIRTPPASLAWSGATQLIGEDLAAIAGTPAAAAPAQPVMLQCLACRAPLRADGSDRFVACTSCAVRNHLPDEVWARLHPPVSPARWYACVTARPQVQVQAPPPMQMPAPMPMPAPQAVNPPQLQQLQQLVVQSGARMVITSSRSNDSNDSNDDDNSDAEDAAERLREAAEEKAENERWSDLENFCVDANQVLYCGGEVGNGNAVWAMNPDQTLRWVRRDLEMSDIRVALDVKGQHLLAWTRGKHSACLLNTSDGSTVGWLGGREPDDAKRHWLDMDCCDHLIGDLDGTWIALMDNRLLRYDVHGNGVLTWPARSGMFAKAEKLESLHIANGGRRERRSVEDVSVEEVGNHPTALDDYATIAIGWDGRFYAEYSEWVACFDRDGKRLWRIKLPLNDVDGKQMGADATGHLFLRGSVDGDPERRVVARVTPDGSRCDIIAIDRLTRGVIGGEDKLAVAPDGTLYLMSYGMRVRILGPDGALRWQSPKSIAEDADEDREQQRRA